MKPNTETIFLPPREVANLFGVSVSTVYKWVSEGRLPALKTMGHQNRFEKDQIDNLIKGQKTNAKKGSNQDDKPNAKPNAQ